MVEIPSGAALRDCGFEVGIGRADDPCARLDRGLAPHAGEGALLDQAEQLHLHQHWQLADLVEEQDAIADAFDVPVMTSLGTGKGPPRGRTAGSRSGRWGSLRN